MKVLALQGSPRKKGNTAALLDNFIKGLEQTASHTVKVISLDKVDIKPCRACDSCKALTDRYCVINDDMKDLYQDFIDSELVVFSTPVYWWSISAQLKLFVDRLYALSCENRSSIFKDKKIVLILAYGDKDPNSGAELVIKMFEEISGYTGMQIERIIRYSSNERHVSECPEKLREAYEAGVNLKG